MKKETHKFEDFLYDDKMLCPGCGRKMKIILDKKEEICKDCGLLLLKRGEKLDIWRKS